MLLAPLLATLGALLSVMDDDVGWCLLVTAQGRLPVAWGRVEFGRLIVCGILGGDAAQLLGGVHENIIHCLEAQLLLCVVNTAFGHLRPCPLGVTAVSPPVAVFALTWVLRSTFGLRFHLASPSTSLGFDALASLPQRGLGREISRWWWCHPCRGGLYDGPLPTGPSMNRASGWVRQAPPGAFRQLCSGDGMNLR
jgi:hypothetical protein